MTNIAIIGLGIMGLPMAQNLVKAGHTVSGYNRSPARTEALAAAGGVAATSAAEAAEGAAVVLTMLPDSPDVEATLLGERGLMATMPAGTLFIDASTIAPDAAVDLHRAARERGHRFVDAPVSGGEAGAIEGTLSVMVGGEADDFDAARGILDAVGTTIVHVGGPGAGQTVKAANQLIVAGNLAVLAEAVLFLESFEVDMSAAIDVLAGGLAGSTVLNRKGAAMAGRDFRPGFRIRLHNKDLGIYSRAARQAGVSSPLGAAVSQLMYSAQLRGSADCDHSAVLTVLESLSGRVAEATT